MGARQKLNQAYFNGAFALSAVIGLVTQSWTVFWISLVLVIGSSLYGGNIRTGPRRGK